MIKINKLDEVKAGKYRSPNGKVGYVYVRKFGKNMYGGLRVIMEAKTVYKKIIKSKHYNVFEENFDTKDNMDFPLDFRYFKENWNTIK